jgi:hypothetical protein
MWFYQAQFQQEVQEGLVSQVGQSFNVILPFFQGLVLHSVSNRMEKSIRVQRTYFYYTHPFLHTVVTTLPFLLCTFIRYGLGRDAAFFGTAVVVNVPWK